MATQVFKTKFPLEEAYRFSEEHGGELWRQVQHAKNKRVPHEPNQRSSVRRGLIIELFERYGVLDEFVHSRWPKSPADNCEKELDRCRRLLGRYREKHGSVT